ncbi:MAG: hypothetical protein IPG04_42045 [Polyangiaceae bacterium]|nr:hypothetical protein [Polyangiaceae bacterium]
MRGYAYVDEPAFRGNGSNVSSTLKQLCDRGQKDALLAFVRKLPKQDITDIDFLCNQRIARLLSLHTSRECAGALPPRGPP